MTFRTSLCLAFVALLTASPSASFQAAAFTIEDADHLVKSPTSPGNEYLKNFVGQITMTLDVSDDAPKIVPCPDCSS